MLASGHGSATHVPEISRIHEAAASVTEDGDLILSLGAGNIHEAGQRLAQDLKMRDTLQSVMGQGRIKLYEPLSKHTTMRIGGPAQFWVEPESEEGFADLVRHCFDENIALMVMGRGSNLLVRDGGVRGVVIRLGRGFTEIETLPGHQLRAGAGVPDVKVARAAAEAGISGLAFYRGIPGSIGGALRMNAGAHGRETKDALISARAIDRTGRIQDLSNADMGFTYRHCSVPSDLIFTSAIFAGEPGEPAAILREMDEVADYRERVQPIRERTGGSTFKNPDGHSAWRLVDAAGLRGFRVGGAKVSDMHCNFLINDQGATAEDVERLGETVRARVKANSGVDLHWEIIRLGEPLSGHAVAEALVVAD
jgi:UDP-N-acetylmuramate dehydrogenase